LPEIRIFAVETWRSAPQTFTATVAILLVAITLDHLTRARGGHQEGPASLGQA